MGSGRDKTFLILADNAPRFEKAGLITTFETSNITIKSMTLDGNRDKQIKDDSLNGSNYGKFGVYTECNNDTLLDDLRVINHWGYGLDPHGKHLIYRVGRHLSITNNVVEFNGFDGITGSILFFSFFLFL